MASSETAMAIEEVDVHTLDGRELARHFEKTAISEVAKRKGKLEEIPEIQRRQMADALEGKARGSDGASAFTPHPRLQQAFREVDAQNAERKSRFNNGGRVAKLPGNVVGEEHDDTREMFLDESVVTVDAPEAQSTEVGDHEFRHTQQATQSNLTKPAAKTDDAEVDEFLDLGLTEYREEDAMDYAGDEFTSLKYHQEYKGPVNRVAAYLNKGGENGNTLIRNAGLKGEIQQVHDAVMRVYRKGNYPVNQN